LILALILLSVATFGASARPAGGKIGIERKRQETPKRPFPSSKRPAETACRLG
jgi:hypothetical protein